MKASTGYRVSSFILLFTGVMAAARAETGLALVALIMGVLSGASMTVAAGLSLYERKDQ